MLTYFLKCLISKLHQIDVISVLILLAGLQMLSRLSNLKMLDLSGNSFYNSILSSVARLSSLTSLDLSENRLEGSINVRGK